LSDSTPAKVSRTHLVGSADWQLSKRAEGHTEGNERALSVQTLAHLDSLAAYAAGLDTGFLGRNGIRDLGKGIRDRVPGCFGENLFCKGKDFHSANICVGDEFTVIRNGRQVVLKVQVSSPRRPCSHVDERHGRTTGRRGIRAQCARTSWAGFFLRVLGAGGTVMAGDVFRLSARPNPSWNLLRVQTLLYSHNRTSMLYLWRGVLREEWMGTDAELRELADVEELAVCEYREEVFKMLKRPGIGCYKAGGPGFYKGQMQTPRWTIWGQDANVIIFCVWFSIFFAIMMHRYLLTGNANYIVILCAVTAFELLN
jgi:hypothetical protein